MEIGGNALQARALAKLETIDLKIDKNPAISNRDESESKLYGQTESDVLNCGATAVGE